MKIYGIPADLYFVCFTGSLVLYFKLKSDGKNVIEFLPQINKSWSNSIVIRILDVVLFSVFGAVIGTLLTQPDNPQQALAAGLGWTGLLSSLGKTQT